MTENPWVKLRKTGAMEKLIEAETTLKTPPKTDSNISRVIGVPPSASPATTPPKRMSLTDFLNSTQSAEINAKELVQTPLATTPESTTAQGSGVSVKDAIAKFTKNSEASLKSKSPPSQSHASQTAAKETAPNTSPSVKDLTAKFNTKTPESTTKTPITKSPVVLPTKAMDSEPKPSNSNVSSSDSKPTQVSR